MMAFTALHDASRTGNEHVRELAPVFLIVIDNERDLRVVSNVAQTLELSGRTSLWLFVDGRVEVFAVESEADRDHVRLPGSIRRGEMSDTGRANQACGANGNA